MLGDAVLGPADGGQRLDFNFLVARCVCTHNVSFIFFPLFREEAMVLREKQTVFTVIFIYISPHFLEFSVIRVGINNLAEATCSVQILHVV